MTTRKFSIKIDGKVFVAEVEEMGGISRPAAAPQSAPKPTPTQTQAPQAPAAGNAIVAPMPGKVLDIKVSKGQQIKVGDVVLILEAMKMEQEIKSSLEGTVSEIAVKDGETVKKEQALIMFD